jgi:hypothetical protein
MVDQTRQTGKPNRKAKQESQTGKPNRKDPPLPHEEGGKLIAVKGLRV